MTRCRLLMGALVAAVLCGCTHAGGDAAAKPKQRDLVIWGFALSVDDKGTQGLINEFERLHPHIRIRSLSLGAGGMNGQKLMTSIVGNVAPDVINQDRFEISDWASRDAFMPLDDLMARDKNDPLDPRPENFYPAPWAEACFKAPGETKAHVYGIPTGADNRVLYYNTDLFKAKAAQLRAAGLDPNRAPRTWSETLAYSKVLTEFNSDGSLKVAGFMPNYGNSWLYLYAFQLNTNFLSPDGRTCTLDTPESEQALRFMRDGYNVIGGYQAAKNFESGFLSNEQDPFIIGKVAMKIDGDWIDSALSRYGPGLQFATAPAPVPDDRFYHRGRFAYEKDTYITWVGGYSLAIPRGAHNVQDAWEFIKFATSLQGWQVQDRTQRTWDRHLGRTYIPRQVANREANEWQFKALAPVDPRFAASVKTHKDVMPFGRIRPPTMVGSVLWQEHVKATDDALYGKVSIHDALAAGQATVQRELDSFYDQDRYPIVNLSVAGYIAVAVAVVGLAVAVIWFKRLRLGKIERTEAKWAYLFVSPWIIGFLVFTLGPMIASLFFSLTQYDVLQPARFVGLKNFADMFGADRENVLKAFTNVGYLAGVGVPLGILTGLGVALLLNSAARGMRIYRTLFYLPAIVPTVAATVLWSWVLSADPDKGLIDSLWRSTLTAWLHAPPPGWIQSADWSKPALIVMGLWGAGSGMILWLAGLKGIPNTLYEAAEIDGASPRKLFVNVTLPMLSPVIFFNVVMGFIGALQEFDRVFILKSNDGPVGPAESLLVPVYHLFNNGFTLFKMGYASALAWGIFAVILVITGFQFKLAPRWVHYEANS
ncbi:MAG: extracellular solute-binding protein [Fimbriimonadaceae bacterium]